MQSCTANSNIIKFIDTFCTEKSILIVMEFCPDGSLEKYINKMKRLSEDKATHFLKQIINGFKGLHERNIIHRDFKADNVLLRAGQLKIADLGFAKMLSGENSVTNTCLGTPLTMAPEIYDGIEYGMKADLWSLGIVYYQMIFGRYPYNGNSELEINKACRHPPQFNGVILSDNAKDFISKCLTYDQKTRISWK